MRAGVFSLIFAVIAVGCLSSAALARPMHDRHSLDQILPQIRQHHPGTLYDADGPFMGPDGREHYRLKWMTPQGRVQWLDADARSGRVTNAPGRYDSFDDGSDRADPYDGERGRYDDGDRSPGDRDDRGRNRYVGDGGLGDPFERGGDGDGSRRHNAVGNWDRGERDNRGDRGNGGYGGWQNHGGGDHRHRGHH